MMHSIFEDLIEGCIVIIYMDDIFLFAKTPLELENNTKQVLQRLKENNLFLKPGKCEFCKTKIEWLGMIIEEGKISMDPGKVKGISEWPSPTTVKQTRGFLGFGIFYRRFIRHFSEIGGLYTPPHVPPETPGIQRIPLESAGLKSWNVLV